MHFIQVRLTKNRELFGHLYVVEEPDTLILVCRCLGKADNESAKAAENPTRNPLWGNGDTPTGRYGLGIPRQKLATKENLHSYGPHPCLPLTPISGQARQAAQNGREGLMIHGGDFGANGQLRPTHGCLRLSNADQKVLVDLIYKLGGAKAISHVDIVEV